MKNQGDGEHVAFTFDPGVVRAEGVMLLTSAHDIVVEWWKWVLLWLMLSAVVVLFVKACIREEKEKAVHEAAWMAECQQDKKHYECEAMWRAGEKHDTTTVIPMPVVISH